jgi:hypothetical protein
MLGMNKKTQKLIMLLLLLHGLALHAYSQSVNNISIETGVAANDAGKQGDYGPNAKVSLLYGVNYTLSLSDFCSIGSGVLLSTNTSEKIFAQNAPSSSYCYGKVEMASFPVYAQFFFLDHLYADVGATADFKVGNSNKTIADNQSGIGYLMGIGCKFNFDDVSVSMNPFLNVHRVIVTNDNSPNGLLDAGVKFSVGYNF